MPLKEKFLSIKEYKAYKTKREVFKQLDFTDSEISNHYMKPLVGTEMRIQQKTLVFKRAV